MKGSKITRQTDRQFNERLENNSPNGWTDGELNERLENYSPKGWTYGEFKISLPNGWKSKE